MFTEKDNSGENAQKGNDLPFTQLSHAQILGQESSEPKQINSRYHSIADRYHEWRARASHKLAQMDIAPDLAEDIGSKRWLRGAATLIGLSFVAFSAWPGFSAVEAAPAMAIDTSVRDEMRSQMIMPLALGADSGRRMGETSAVIPLASAPERPSIDLVATLTRGDSFARMLRRAGVGEGEAEQISSMISSAVELEEIEPGTRVDITLGRRIIEGGPRPLDMLSFRARFDLDLAVERRGDSLELDPRPIMVDTTPLRVRGEVGRSLYRSARASGAPAGAVQQFLRVIGNELDLNREIASSDSYDFIVEYKRAATGEVEVGDVLYAAIHRDGELRRGLLRWGPEGRYYDTAGGGEQREGLMAPVPGRITSRYGMRSHPILGYRRMHSGLDFRASRGTPIHAVTDGRVEFAGRNGSYGNFVRLRHDGNLGTGYAHMSRIAVSRGEQVRRGQVIGYVGSTGLSTGPHLHYEMYRGDRKIDPSGVRFVTRAQLEGRELREFQERLRILQRVEPGAALVSLVPEGIESDEPVREIDRIGGS